MLLDDKGVRMRVVDLRWLMPLPIDDRADGGRPSHKRVVHGWAGVWVDAQQRSPALVTSTRALAQAADLQPLWPSYRPRDDRRVR
jgi:hypothetical protein